MESIAIHESKESEKVVKFLQATVKDLSAYCSTQYAKRILKAKDNGTLWGCYFVGNKIKATFI